VTLIRSKKDNRDESYKLVSVNEHKRVISCSNEKRLILNRCVLRSDEDPIELQNRKRLSIALVKPNQSGMILSLENRDPSETEEWFFASQNMPVRAYMSWVSNAGKEHKSHICSHEVMEGLRKNLSNPWDVFNNMKVIERDYEKWLLLGTMANRRSTWLIVHVHRLKKTTGQITKQSSWTEDGRLEGWPYLNKEARFARRVVQERQGYLFTMSDT
jgi:hypothetical protein